ncbi:MAG TPA: RNA polymerase sigma factor [Pyrinomonadaceae bacterium]|jgi:RNA polymerase sigma factor (sigma-70 family)|nr:RNA polymerase sigma factor [Pyrinomonadaceae bacterium]
MKVENTKEPFHGHLNNAALTTVRAKKEDDFPSDPFEGVQKYWPYIRHSCNDISDAEDVMQSAGLKVAKMCARHPKRVAEIDNKRAYIFRIVQSAINDFYRGHRFEIVSLDEEQDESSKKEIREPGDEGQAAHDTEMDIVLKDFKLQAAELLDDFSDYEKTLVQLNYYENIKPRKIAEMIKADYPEKIPEQIPPDVNLAKAKFRYHLNKLRKKLKLQ